jgi:hypothetical protein
MHTLRAGPSGYRNTRKIENLSPAKPKGPFGWSASAGRHCENYTIMLTDSCALLPRSTLATRPSKMQPNGPQAICPNKTSESQMFLPIELMTRTDMEVPHGLISL